MRIVLIYLSFLYSLCLNSQPNTLGPINVVHFDNDCNSYSGSWNDPSTTSNGVINNNAGGVAMNCALPATFIYNLSSAQDITTFWLETKVGSVVDNGINAFEVKYYDGFNGVGNLLHTQSSSAALMNGWQSFNTSVTVIGVKSFSFKAITQHGPSTAEFDEVGLTSTASLPIELTEFNLHQLGENQVQLEWTTASEINNEYFSLEKSKDGINWLDFAIVNGQGDSNILTNYRYIDEDPFFEISYYRLKQVDFDQAYSFSPIETIIVNQERKIKLFPNPAVSNITVQRTEMDKEYEDIELLNILGRNVNSQVSFSNIESNSVRIELNNLPRGIYFLKIGSALSKFYVE